MDNNEIDKYLRIGTQIYKIGKKPSGEETLIPWSSQAIYQDYGKDKGNEIIGQMEKYDGWVNEPSHVDYQPVIGRWLNLYQPLPHAPRPGVDFPLIRQFLEHIFGQQYELGLDYLQLLYTQPKQKLPILLLVSKERNTGKTTFLKFLKEIFGVNATFNTNEDFKSQFNSDWANKLLIMVDETFLNRKEQAERLKSLSTAIIYKVEGKGKDRVEVEFHGHFVLCSNNTLCPVLIEPGETRYWVVSVPTLKTDDTLLMEKIEYEIPAFLNYLVNRQLITERKSRMWFDFELYHTPALDRIIANGRESLEADMADAFNEVFESVNVESLDYCPKDVVQLLQAAGCRKEIKEREVRRVFRLLWELEPAENTLTYTCYLPNYSANNYIAQQRVGRYYSLRRKFIQNLTS